MWHRRQATRRNPSAELYDARRQAVAAATGRLRAVLARPHSPAEAREAARALQASVERARGAVLAALGCPGPAPAELAPAGPAPAELAPAGPAPARHAPQAPHRPHLHRPHRRFNPPRAVPGPALYWSNELVRLAETLVWLRRVTQDDLGVTLPTVVRVGSRAAGEPHIPGLQFESPALVAATIAQPRIGVSLEEIVAGYRLPGQAAPSRPRRERAARPSRASAA